MAPLHHMRIQLGDTSIYPLMVNWDNPGTINNARTLDWRQAGKMEARLYPLVRSTRPVKRQSIGKRQRCIYLNKGIKETCGSASEA